MEILITNLENSHLNKINLNKVNTKHLSLDRRNEYLRLYLMEYFIVKIRKKVVDCRQVEIIKKMYEIIYEIDDCLLDVFTDDSIIMMVKFISMRGEISGIIIDEYELKTILEKVKNLF